MNKILVTGATGKIATDIVPQLVRARADVRAMVHDAAKAAPIKALGSETIVGDYGDTASLEQALDGVSTVLFLTPPGPDAWTRARDFLDIAKRNPKLRIVRISALKASVSGPTPNTRSAICRTRTSSFARISSCKTCSGSARRSQARARSR
jgi:uncharacterized protein YbjT (DUF2867 family)